ncbi:MAG: DNA repair protein RecN [Flavobacteriales bacterium]|nr:DNA repair protein RecN [Flavobacteriales bacterium]MDG1349352.1 DNA repair protein RecN [Flavobacteriales bacterium]|tara:strand:- start:1333 stop:2970 length:1638 start_codon:yes stop_codon:yes gene_type:complete
MIKSLQIQNYALLKDVCINFMDGFTVVSGETGAGKSIMLDALSLLLGKRVERFSEDKNTSKSIIEGVFLIDSSRYQFFKDNDLDFDEETVVRREINQNGKSRAFINDTPVLLNTLTAFGKQVVEIHAQHQSVLLKDEDAQFKLIDQLAKSEKELANYQHELKGYTRLKSELITIKKSGSLSAAELEFLQYQFDELNTANLLVNEKEELEQQISLLENVDGIAKAISESEFLLNNEQGILTSISTIKRQLLEFDSFNEISERVESLLIELNDINVELSDVNNKLEADPEELLRLNNRLDILNNLLQKHRKQFVEELIDFKDEVEQKIQISSSFDLQLKAKQSEITKQLSVLKISSEILTKKRIKVLEKLKKEIETHLQNLGMPYAQFQVNLKTIDTFHQNGNTDITFLFSANKGSALQEVSKVASGGELSRLMLSIKYITAQSSKVNTLVFDEIDTGVSGEIASLMGDMMLEISKTNQLVAISHLPQIASKANTHLKVVKTVNRKGTISDVIVLNKEQRIEEIAKLLSGKKLTKAAIDNAVELLNQ